MNGKFALSTLERMRRYADELGYTVPAEEEAEVWRVFESQPEDITQSADTLEFPGIVGHQSQTLAAGVSAIIKS